MPKVWKEQLSGCPVLSLASTMIQKLWHLPEPDSWLSDGWNVPRPNSTTGMGLVWPIHSPQLSFGFQCNPQLHLKYPSKPTHLTFPIAIRHCSIPIHTLLYIYYTNPISNSYTYLQLNGYYDSWTQSLYLFHLLHDFLHQPPSFSYPTNQPHSIPKTTIPIRNHQ